jgi:hypothetical protein
MPVMAIQENTVFFMLLLPASRRPLFLLPFGGRSFNMNIELI